jgi:hypothetical protein
LPNHSQETSIISEKKLDLSPSLTCIRLDDPICTLTVDNRTLTYLNNELKKHVVSFSQTGTTSFIHAKTPPSTLLTSMRILVATLTSDEAFDYTSRIKAIQRDHLSLLNHCMESLISALPTLYSYDTLLPFTQSLILFQILTTFIFPASLLPAWIQQSSEARHQLLKRVTRQLWESAPVYLPPNLSRHDAYALAESIRRTTIMSHELQAQCSVYRRGFFEYGLFAASLPFGRRFELWDANALEFEDAMVKMKDESGSLQMVSYREFCDMFDRMEIESIARPFEIMVLVGAKGLDLVEQTYGFHLT